MNSFRIVSSSLLIFIGLYLYSTGFFDVYSADRGSPSARRSASGEPVPITIVSPSSTDGSMTVRCKETIFAEWEEYVDPQLVFEDDVYRLEVRPHTPKLMSAYSQHKGEGNYLLLEKFTGPSPFVDLNIPELVEPFLGVYILRVYVGDYLHATGEFEIVGA